MLGSRERKVDSRAGFIREFLSHGRAEALRKEMKKSAEERLDAEAMVNAVMEIGCLLA